MAYAASPFGGDAQRWYTCPTIINTFMEAYDFKGKTVIPFATSGGSSIKTGQSSESHPNLFEDDRVVTDEDKVKACEDLKTAYPDVNWKEGKLLNRVTKKELEDWVKKQ